MAHAVDFVLKVMEEISSSKPVLFQRDGSLYVASREGFGQVTYGLRTRPEEIQSWERRSQSPDIAESVDAIKELQISEDYPHLNIPVFLDGEQDYLRAIAFSDDSFSLEEIAAAAQKLAGLPDDGKVRMVNLSGESDYHPGRTPSVDDVDARIRTARVMGMDRYLELVRGKEDQFLREFEQLGQAATQNLTERRNIEHLYSTLTFGYMFPNGVIVTPYMMVSFPRKGTLHQRGEEPNSWTSQTKLQPQFRHKESYRSILYHSLPSTYDESPFKVDVTLNAHNLENAGAGNKVLERVGAELSAVKSNIAIAEEFSARMNAAHNTVSAPNIEMRKSWRKPKSAEATAPQ